jgi:MFS family permease
LKLRDRIPDPNVIRVFIATFGSGLAFAMGVGLLPLFLKQHAFEKSTIGSLAAWFAAGIVLFSIPMGRFIDKFGAKTLLVLSLAGYTITVSVFPFLDDYTTIGVVRFFDGAFSVGVWVSSETILLQRGSKENKAFVTSLYAVTMALGYVAGPFVGRFLMETINLESGFVGAGVVSFISAVYVAARIEKWAPHTEADLTEGATRKSIDLIAPLAGSMGRLLWRIKNPCFATFAFGYFQASMVLFLPLFLMENKGVAPEQTILIPSFFAAGLLLFTNIGGRLGDRFGHLFMMRSLAFVGLSMTLGFVFLQSFNLMAVAIFVAGATFATISPLSLALQGIMVHPLEYARANSIYNAFYAAGMLVGPPLSSLFFEQYSGETMLYHLAGLWFSFVAFSMVFRLDDPAARRQTLTMSTAS